MLGLFVHDHKFPMNDSEYYNSYGFDKEFFNRYLSIFGNLAVIGREKNIEKKDTNKIEAIDSSVDFYTIKNLKQLGNKKIREEIDQKIIDSDYLVVRLPSILGLYAIMKAKKFKKPYLIEVVGCPWDALSNKGFSKLLPAYVVTYLTKKAIYSAKYVVYVTEEFLEKRYPTKGKYIACSNVTLSEVNECDLNSRLEKIVDKNRTGKIILGTCATIDVIYKGQQDVIKAISRLKKEGYEIEYQLVGGGDPNFLENEALKYGVLEEVKFIGSLDHAEVFDWLEEIDIYVHPSKQEGLSRAIIESMSKACPVFSADAGGIHELIDEEFIFDKGSIDQICNIYKKFSINIMKEQATLNQNNSKKYLKSVLYNRRKQFFKEYISDSRNYDLESNL